MHSEWFRKEMIIIAIVVVLLAFTLSGAWGFIQWIWSTVIF